VPRSQTPPPRQRLAARLAQRSAAEQAGFTLIELVVVILILGIMVSISVPAYLKLQERADKSAAMTNVRAVTSDVEAYYADNGTFNGISATVLHNNYDTTVDTSLIQVASTSGGTSFILCSKSHGFYGFKLGPAALVDSSATAPSGCTL
jgi:general secretion pathway protein G